MRAKTVNEANFERGLDPKTAMGIGDKEIQTMERLDRLAKKYGFEEAPFGSQHEEGGIINIKRWVMPDTYSDDDVEVLLFKQKNSDYPPEVYYNTGYSDGQDDAEDWFDESRWKHTFG